MGRPKVARKPETSKGKPSGRGLGMYPLALVGAAVAACIAVVVTLHRPEGDIAAKPAPKAYVEVQAESSGRRPAAEGLERPSHKAQTAQEPTVRPTRARTPELFDQYSAITLEASLVKAMADAPDGTGAEDPHCVDQSDSCDAWAHHAECESNAGYMHVNCPRACGLCGPKSKGKPVWGLTAKPGIDWPALEVEAAAHPPTAAELERCGVAPLLSPRAIPGLHVACVLAPAVPADAAQDAVVGLSRSRVALWRDADASQSGPLSPSRLVALPRVSHVIRGADDALENMGELLATLGALLSFEWRGPQWQTPAFFTPDGARLLTLKAVANAGSAGSAICLYEGGQFIWPPGRVNSTRYVRLPDGHQATIRTVSLQPVVLSIENFLRPEETGHIVDRALPHLVKSGVALKDADRGREAKEFRTSSQYFLPTSGDPKLEEIDARVQALMRVPITHAEYIQVLRYNYKEHYSAHHDYFDPKDYAGNAHMRRETKEGAKNRLATVFFYLSDVPEGGATNFPRAGGGPPPRDFFDCSRGLSVYPQNGKVIVFYSMHPSSALDPFSLHGGCDVYNGTKYSANFWLWNEPYHFFTEHRVRAFEEYRASMWLSD